MTWRNFTPPPMVSLEAILQKNLEQERQSLFKEGVMYACELAYFVWVMLSLALCSGMFVENPVAERHGKNRYYLSVLGLSQSAYWLGNILFDLSVYILQASFMLILVLPLELEAYSLHYSEYAALLLSFGLAHVTFSYFVSFWFSTP